MNVNEWHFYRWGQWTVFSTPRSRRTLHWQIYDEYIITYCPNEVSSQRLWRVSSRSWPPLLISQSIIALLIVICLSLPSAGHQWSPRPYPRMTCPLPFAIRTGFVLLRCTDSMSGRWTIGMGAGCTTLTRSLCRFGRPFCVLLRVSIKSLGTRSCVARCRSLWVPFRRSPRAHGFRRSTACSVLISFCRSGKLIASRKYLSGTNYGRFCIEYPWWIRSCWVWERWNS